jgi:TonB family protein
MGTKPVAARLEVLPDGPSRKSALMTSVVLQTIVAAFVVALPLFFPDQLKLAAYQVIPLAPLRTEYILPTPEPPKPPARRPEVRPEPRPVEEPVARPQITRRTVFAPMPMTARPRPVEVRRTELPQVNQTFSEIKLVENSNEPARPRDPVKTGIITTGSAAPATITKPTDIAQVQTGGFGDVRGLPGPSNPNRPATIARLGSPALPPGPGYGNGTGGATGARGTVASTGFGNGVAIQPNAPVRGEVRGGGFSTAEVGIETPRARQVETVAAVQPVVILEKPNPVYTQEARRLGLEGEVLIEVVFPASGAVRIVRVVKGLGHGLDEAAIRAAQQIRFKPALQQGRAVDFPATVHIVFQLAF